MKFNYILSKMRCTCKLISQLAACEMLQKQLIDTIKCISALVLLYEKTHETSQGFYFLNGGI